MAKDMRLWINQLEEAGVLARIENRSIPARRWGHCCGRHETAHCSLKIWRAFQGGAALARHQAISSWHPWLSDVGATK